MHERYLEVHYVVVATVLSMYSFQIKKKTGHKIKNIYRRES